MSETVELITFGLSAFAAIFTIVNPVGNIPFFVALTEGYSLELKLRVAKKVVVVATITLFLFALAGNYIFLIFHTSIHAFRIAGGVLLFSIAFTMMHGERPTAKLTDREKEEALSKEVVGVVPLGIPMFAGPGAITTAMVLMAGSSVPTLSLMKAALVFLSILTTMAMSYVLLLRSDSIVERFGRMGMMAFSRIMGLLLAAIAVQFIILGVQGAWMEYFVGSALG
ncbi:MAG: MarC family protein [Thermoplasmata archaeon]